jgi:hypothetical protein
MENGSKFIPDFSFRHLEKQKDHEYTMGNFIYILLVAAVIMILVRLIQGNKV